MNTKLVESLAEIIRSLTSEERSLLEAHLHSTPAAPSPIPDSEPILRGSTAEDLLQFAGTWEGDDLEECLQLVYKTRSKAKF